MFHWMYEQSGLGDGKREFVVIASYVGGSFALQTAQRKMLDVMLIKEEGCL